MPRIDSGRKVGIRMAKFAPDGRGVYLLTDEDGEFAQLKLKDPVTHQSRSVTPATGWDVEDFDVSSDGRYLAYVVNDDGRSRLTVLDTQAKAELAVRRLPAGRIGNLRFDRATLARACRRNRACARDVYVYDLEHGKLELLDPQRAGPAGSGHARAGLCHPLSHLIASAVSHACCRRTSTGHAPPRVRARC